jgi:ABC-type multidrug transport system fused ATPase/permease subunit
MRSGQSVFVLAVTVVLVGYGGYLVLQGVTTLGTLVAMQALFGLVLQPVNQLAGLAREAQKTAGAAERVYGFLDVPPQVADRAGARPPLPGPLPLVFDRVGFAYEPGRPVLDEISFAVQPGETVALVGPSGAGKTSLVSLLPRFYDPTSGRILLGGDDLRDLSLQELRARIGFVFQDTFLFSGTVRENVALGAPAADEAAVGAALEAANAAEFVARLPQGLDTRVGERGAHLSEGQKQRLSLARALLRDPAILILDEPTSALDARAEAVVQTALERATRGRTTFVVAHRLATVQRADRILVLDGGRIVQQGTHDALLEQDGLYRDLCLLQFDPLRAAPAAPLADRAGDDVNAHREAVLATASGSNA